MGLETFPWGLPCHRLCERPVRDPESSGLGLQRGRGKRPGQRSPHLRILRNKMQPGRSMAWRRSCQGVGVSPGGSERAAGLSAWRVPPHAGYAILSSPHCKKEATEAPRGDPICPPHSCWAAGSVWPPAPPPRASVRPHFSPTSRHLSAVSRLSAVRMHYSQKPETRLTSGLTSQDALLSPLPSTALVTAAWSLFVSASSPSLGAPWGRTMSVPTPGARPAQGQDGRFL